MNMPPELRLCPVVGCTWTFNSDRLPPMRLMVGAGGLDEAFAAMTKKNAEATERILREHLESHELLDFVRTIHHLQCTIAGYESGIRPHVYANYPQDAGPS